MSTPSTVARVPNKRAPGVRVRNFACHDDLWNRFIAAVEYNHDKPASEVIRKLIEGYTKRAEKKMEQQ
jgi:hypothetical protein